MLDLGSVHIRWLDGGEFRPDGGAMFGPVPKRVWSRAYPCDPDNLVTLAARPLLLETRHGWMLVDGGFGHHLDERQRRLYNVSRAGRLAESLAEAGVAPAQVEWVVLTHLHLDHASGLVAEGSDGRLRPLFPRARHVVQAIEVGEMASPHERERHAYEQRSWRPLVESGLVEQVDGTRELAPGVEVFLTGGHSRGHQGLLLRSDGGVVLHLGDVLPTAAHLRPLWVSALDDFPLDSIEVKRRWLGRAIEGSWWIAFYHDHRVLAGRCGADYTLQDEVAAR